MQREHERHGGQGSHYELRGSRGLEAAQKKAAEAAAAAREQYRQQLRANKKRIEDSLQNRKSLMERHDSVANCCNFMFHYYYVLLSDRTAADIVDYCEEDRRSGGAGESRGCGRGRRRCALLCHTYLSLSCFFALMHVYSLYTLDRRKSGAGTIVADHADLFDPKEQIRLGLKDLY